jgi:hypothetical protein
VWERKMGKRERERQREEEGRVSDVHVKVKAVS